MVCNETSMDEIPKDCFDCCFDCNFDKAGERPVTCRLFIRPDIDEARNILRACCDDSTLSFDQALEKLGYSKNSR